MKTLILLIFLLVPAQLWAFNPLVVCSGEPAAAASCATCSEDQASTDGTTNNDIIANATGQSFQVSKNGTLCYIDIYMAYIQDNSQIEVRWGNTANLTEYQASKILTFTSTDDVQYQRFTFDTKANVSTGTTYYLGVVKNSGTTVISKRNNVGTYANGNLYNALSAGWNMNNSSVTYDFNFKVGLCD